MEKPVEQGKKKIYNPPELTVYGTVLELTQHLARSGRLDGGRNFARTA